MKIYGNLLKILSHKEEKPSNFSQNEDVKHLPNETTDRNVVAKWAYLSVLESHKKLKK